jgi:hypothetical protein
MSLGKKGKKTLEEIRQVAKEPEYDEIIKIVKITKTERGLVVRIPKEISEYHKIAGWEKDKKGDMIRFYTKLKAGENKLVMELVKDGH